MSSRAKASENPCYRQSPRGRHNLCVCGCVRARLVLMRQLAILPCRFPWYVWRRSGVMSTEQQILSDRHVRNERG